MYSSSEVTLESSSLIPSSSSVSVSVELERRSLSSSSSVQAEVQETLTTILMLASVSSACCWLWQCLRKDALDSAATQRFICTARSSDATDESSVLLSSVREAAELSLMEEGAPAERDPRLSELLWSVTSETLRVIFIARGLWMFSRRFKSSRVLLLSSPVGSTVDSTSLRLSLLPVSSALWHGASQLSREVLRVSASLLDGNNSPTAKRESREDPWDSCANSFWSFRCVVTLSSSPLVLRYLSLASWLSPKPLAWIFTGSLWCFFLLSPPSSLIFLTICHCWSLCPVVRLSPYSAHLLARSKTLSMSSSETLSPSSLVGGMRVTQTFGSSLWNSRQTSELPVVSMSPSLTIPLSLSDLLVESESSSCFPFNRSPRMSGKDSAEEKEESMLSRFKSDCWDLVDDDLWLYWGCW